ncbi:MAG: sodium:solute symporter family protein [Acidimicrobiales bacterium]
MTAGHGPPVVLAGIQVVQASVILVLFAGVTVLGIAASRWRRADLNQIDEWALGGRRFGGFLTWFLQGGSVYTTYSFIAIPALVYGTGAAGFYALPYLVIAYPVAFVFLPRLWEVANRKGYVTSSDYVLDRFGSPLLSLVVTVTGLVAIVPYAALQVYGIEVAIAQVGLPVDASLWTAFGLLAVVTYVSGLRSATLISVAKDVLIWITVLVGVTYIPVRLGGYAHIFATVPASTLTLPAGHLTDYATLAIGSGLFLFLYPHTITGALSASSGFVIQRNSVFLPVYTVMLGLLALMGYMARAANVHLNPAYGANAAVPALFDKMFPPAFAGFALAAIAIGALVPAAMMAIAASNLFARNIWKQYVRPRAGAREETTVAKISSLFVKLGAVAFVVVAPTTYVVNFQLAGGVWMLQVLPAVALALFVPWLDRRWVLCGWAVGIALGTWPLALVHFRTTSYAYPLFGHHLVLYIGIPAVLANLVVVFAGSGIGSVVRTRSRFEALALGTAPPSRDFR